MVFSRMITFLDKKRLSFLILYIYICLSKKVSYVKCIFIKMRSQFDEVRVFLDPKQFLKTKTILMFSKICYCYMILVFSNIQGKKTPRFKHILYVFFLRIKNKFQKLLTNIPLGPCFFLKKKFHFSETKKTTSHPGNLHQVPNYFFLEKTKFK